MYKQRQQPEVNWIIKALLQLQELDLSKEAFMYTESSKEDEWTTIVKASLHPGARYTHVKSIRLVSHDIEELYDKENISAISGG